MTPVTFTAFGTPAGQGNLRRGRHGKSYHANDEELRAWRGRVAAAAERATDRHAFAGQTACARCGTARRKHGLFLGAVQLDAVVAFERPATVRRPHPVTRRHGDWDHHGRSISDALTGLLYADDSQVIDGRVRQVYAGPDAPLPQPGALITIREIP